MQEGEGENVTATTCDKNVWMTKAFRRGVFALRPARGVVAAQQSCSLVVQCSVWVQLINISDFSQIIDL
jgi:hypothetical protein